MNKGIDKVRKSIVGRHKTRRQHLNKADTEKNMHSFLQEEEKHGYLPSHVDYMQTDQLQILPGLLTKGILSVVFFVGVFFLQRSELDLLEKPKEWTNYVFQEEFPFASVYQWYGETFGMPLAYQPQKNQKQGEMAAQGELSLPVSGSVTETFQVNGSGIMISPKEAVSVAALSDGVIIFAGNDRITDKTIVIQHADKSKTTYAHLSSLDVHLYQFISAGEHIGTFNPTETHETVYFSIEKNNKYIDPIQVINVDDIP